jgi:hypothetical protein
MFCHQLGTDAEAGERVRWREAALTSLVTAVVTCRVRRAAADTRSRLGKTGSITTR